jgi:succinate dehydrogenase / fumarate reductase flavoprotein subunit
MQAHCGVFRNQQLLSEGVAKVMELESGCKRVSIKDKSRTFNTARVEALELDNLIETAKATIVSAEAGARAAAHRRAATIRRATMPTGSSTRCGIATAIGSTTSR